MVKGRPRGPSGKYTDDVGNPVGVYEWRDKYRKLERIKSKITITFKEKHFDIIRRLARRFDTSIEILIKKASMKTLGELLRIERELKNKIDKLKEEERELLNKKRNLIVDYITNE